MNVFLLFILIIKYVINPQVPVPNKGTSLAPGLYKIGKDYLSLSFIINKVSNLVIFLLFFKKSKNIIILFLIYKFYINEIKYFFTKNNL